MDKILLNDNESDEEDINSLSNTQKRNIKKKIEKIDLPNTLFPIKGGDKTFKEKWEKGRNLLNIPKSYRMCLTGPPDSGKTHNILHILLRADPSFEKIYLLHFDDTSKDYHGINFEERFSDIPSPLSFEKDTRKALIIEDFCFISLNKQQKKDINRLFSYASSHNNLTIFVCVQNFTDLGSDVRRCCNVFCIFKQPDINALQILARRVGMKNDDFMYIFNKYLLQPHNCLYIDLTLNSPARFRINGFDVLKKVDGEWLIEEENE